MGEWFVGFGRLMGWIEEEKTVRMSYSELGVLGGWESRVAGWVDGLGGWVGGWVGGCSHSARALLCRVFLNRRISKAVYIGSRWVGGWVGGKKREEG